MTTPATNATAMRISTDHDGTPAGPRRARSGSAGASLHSPGDTRTRAGVHRIHRGPGPRGHLGRRRSGGLRPRLRRQPGRDGRPGRGPRRAHTACAAGGGTVAHDPDLAALIDAAEPDLVLNALVGAAGLRPTLAALDRGITVALANKESLVAGGDLVAASRARTGAALVPVDSEHSAHVPAHGGRAARAGGGGDPDRVRRAVPRPERRRPAGGHARRGAAASRPGRWARRSRSTRRPS